MTIGTANRKNISFDSEYNLLNYKGEIPALIHQYDRFPDILHKIKKKFDHDIKINNNNYGNNNLYIYCSILFICIIFIVILLTILCKYFFKRFWIKEKINLKVLKLKN